MSRKSTDERILAIYNEVEDEFSDKSTEFVFQMTADRANVEYGRVIDALSRDHERRKNAQGT